ncbi:N-acetyltransferase family protein [Rhodovibrionaceae bacterium A322]
MSTIVLRKATADDCDLLLEFLKGLASYVGQLPYVVVTAEDLRRDGFGQEPKFEALIAERDQDGQREPLGMALYFFTYSTFSGRPALYLEDFFLTENARGLGLGKIIIKKLSAIALEKNCVRLDLAVLHSNPARGFYNKLGFELDEQWLHKSLSREKMQALLEATPQQGA